MTFDFKQITNTIVRDIKQFFNYKNFHKEKIALILIASSNSALRNYIELITFI